MKKETMFWCAVIAYCDDGHVEADVFERGCAAKPQDTSRRSKELNADIYEEWFFTGEEARRSAREWESSPGIPQEAENG
jgi:hypothetical protein